MRRSLLILVVLASAARADEVARVHHVPPAEVRPGEALRLIAAVDDSWAETALIVRYRQLGSTMPTAARDVRTPEPPYHEVTFERSSAGGWYATIPAAAVRPPGVAYYIVGILPDGKEVAHFASL